MPIRLENRARYPKNWKEVRASILERAGHRCERCGVANHWYGYRTAAGEFIACGFNERLAMVWPLPGDLTVQPFSADVKIIEIVLTVAHLDHIPENCDPENLRAWCQKCHLQYDQDHHAQTARATRHAALNNLELFPEVA